MPREKLPLYLDVHLRVLLVEENQAFRKNFKAVLCARFPGMHIQEAWSPHQATQMLEAQEVDLAFVDINFSQGSGLDLSRKIKCMWPSCSVVILGHHDLPEYREAAENSGASSFLCKDKAALSDIEKLVYKLCPSLEKKGKP